MTEDTLIRIVGPRGTDEVNDSGKRYPISPDGGFYVPSDAVGPLLKTGGCVVQPRTQTEIVADIARLVETLKPGRIRDLFSRAFIDPSPSPLADDETPTDDYEPASEAAVEHLEMFHQPAAEIDDEPPVAPSIARLVIPNPAAVPLGRVSSDG